MSDPQVGEALHQLMHAYKRALRRAYRDADLELSVSHIRALKAIRTLAPCTAQHISQRTQRDKAQITRLLKDLLAADVIARSPHPDDRRSQILSLTPMGFAVLSRIDASERQVHDNLAQRLNVDDLDAFLRLSRLMIDNLQ
ncbi:MarR family winged helix-turn-helix transcriptional regulator [Salinicola rhizosphaerae]|uniref:MarR family transcriptional regulator n=1 Tax=Salinicola rhizosphaerae TaxID=1443141 RepID=A0ABQ3E9F1_9GAMM|nr:MarR family transcriptional regulator [Salinicola rhizosphaerae]GHB27545.1 MarR family transcriptional regulator [Salinicola rhizosphaerae]